MTALMNTYPDQNEGFVYYTHSYSTAEIEDCIFYGESSQMFIPVETAEPEGEHRIIGDELMRVDRVNVPPDKSVLRRISEKD